MSVIKTPTLTVCSYFYLKKMLTIFDEAVSKDPTISTEENRCLRKRFDGILARSFLWVCAYNSKKMLEHCSEKCKNPLNQ